MQRLKESFHLRLAAPGQITALLRYIDRFVVASGGWPASPHDRKATRYLIDPGRGAAWDGKPFWIGIFAPGDELPGEFGERFSALFGGPALHLTLLEGRLLQILAYEGGEPLGSHVGGLDCSEASFWTILSRLTSDSGEERAEGGPPPLRDPTPSEGKSEDLVARLDHFAAAVGIGAWSQRFREAERIARRSDPAPWIPCAYRMPRRRDPGGFSDPLPLLPERIDLSPSLL